MTTDASSGLGQSHIGRKKSVQAESQRQESFPHQNLEHTPSSPASRLHTQLDPAPSAVTNIGYASLQPAQNARISQLAVLDQMMHAVSEQTKRALSDQVTPLRLAGHLSVLMIAGVVLMLSQISIPEWELSLEPTPVASALALAGESAQSAGNDISFASGFGSDSLRPNVVLNLVDKNPKKTVTQEIPVSTEVLYYNVKPGDTVLGIAEKFGLQPETLMWSNSFIEQNPDRLSIGDQLRILPVDGVLHVVKRGDTLASIADEYSADMQAIVAYAANGIASLDDTLPIGKEIVVPGGSKPYVAPYVGESMAYSVERPAGALAGSGNFSWPSAGYISQGYWGGHPAIDVAGWLGAPVTASDAGYVVLAGGGWNSGYGNYVIIDHGNGFTTLYAHLNSIFVSPGETVSRGQQVGTMGNTGNSTGPHLHFEIRYDGVPYNPSGYLK